MRRRSRAVCTEVVMTETVQKHSHLDYEVMIHKDRYRAAHEWCQKQFGRRWEAIGYRTGVWCVFWAGKAHCYQYRFCFAHQQDMMMFVLRWIK
jgi:hypothetical protein